MAQTIVRIKAALMREYYKDFSKYAKGKRPDQKVAWVTSFAPVEILEALGISYCYPESYAAVIAASGKEQPLIEESFAHNLSKNCCSYSCCFNGCLLTEDGPRGLPPMPDVLIATNNQCNTLPGWWNTISQKYNVPLIVIDYPGENADVNTAFTYVTKQHKNLIQKMEALSGNQFDEKKLNELIENSKKSVSAWNKVISYLPTKNILPTQLFDDIIFLITARCKPETSEMYEMMAAAMVEKQDAEAGKTPVFWLGYPLWYHPDRFLKELLSEFRVSGANYLTWWSLDYLGKDSFEKLFNAYNYSFLNLTQNSRNSKLKALISSSGAKGAIVLHNKSCKCDFVSAKNIDLPQAEIDIDMIDRTYIEPEKTKKLIDLLQETICTE